MYFHISSRDLMPFINSRFKWLHHNIIFQNSMAGGIVTCYALFFVILESAVSSSVKQYCIIGAGPAGELSTRAMHTAKFARYARAHAASMRACLTFAVGMTLKVGKGDDN